MSNTGDGTWGHIGQYEFLSRKSVSSDYIPINVQELELDKYSKCTQAAHCMIYSRYDDKVFGIYNPRAAVLMQMRFDGYIGFPGGLVDEGEDVITGLNRELSEEMNFDVEKMPVKAEHHVVSHWNSKQKLTLHFYAQEVSLEDFKKIERDVMLAYDYGTEVMGIIRPPLYTMGDNFRGFPAFLTNAFVGNSRKQLLQSLLHLNIMSQEEISNALQAVPV